MERYLKIVGVKGREILDSRGNPTVEAEVTLENGSGDAPACRPGHLQENLKRWS